MQLVAYFLWVRGCRNERYEILYSKDLAKRRFTSMLSLISNFLSLPWKDQNLLIYIFISSRSIVHSFNLRIAPSYYLKIDLRISINHLLRFLISTLFHFPMLQKLISAQKKERNVMQVINLHVPSTRLKNIGLTSEKIETVARVYRDSQFEWQKRILNRSLSSTTLRGWVDGAFSLPHWNKVGQNPKPPPRLAPPPPGNFPVAVESPVYRS